MTLADYERHLIGRLRRACHAATRPSHRRPPPGPACRRTWRPPRRRARWASAHAFAPTAAARHPTRTVRRSYPTADRAYTAFRSARARPAGEGERAGLG